ncbi:MAG: hypothetical protein JW841_05785 [Deltaproteobacteria bacterium]|nr:hypothetical protein [Deltaproteobacteria bacterium]
MTSIAKIIRAWVHIIPTLVFLSSFICNTPASFAANDSLLHLEDDLKNLSTDNAVTIRSYIERLKQQNITISILEQKLHEGLAKNIPPQKLVTVLQQITENSLWQNTLISSCICAQKPNTKNAMINLGNDALLSAWTRKDLSAAIKIVCNSQDGANKLAIAFELYAYTTNRLRADKKLSLSFALAILTKKSFNTAASNQFVRVLQEIFKTRGNINNVLSFATIRLNRGLSPRNTANEIREQFLSK